MLETVMETSASLQTSISITCREADPQFLCGKGRLFEEDEVVALTLASFRLCVPLSGGFLRVGYDIDPLRVRRGLGVVVVVPVPPLVRRGLGVTLGRVLPSLLPAERRDVEVAP